MSGVADSHVPRELAIVPDEYAQHESGLLVPKAHQRRREVATQAEWKLLHRTIRDVLGPHELRFGLFCNHAGCPAPTIEKLRTPDGGFVLRCGHRDLVFPAAI